MYNHPFPARPLRVIHTKGTDFQVGQQHGEELSSEVAQGMPKFYHDFWKRMTADFSQQPGGGPLGTFFRRAGLKAMDKFILDRLIAAFPGWCKDRILGIASSSRIPESELRLAAVLPDLMPVLESFLVRFAPSRFVEARAPLRFGCSSFVSSGRRFLHGRNLDFPGVAYWDRYPVLQVFEIPQRLRYIGFTSSGVPFAGISGVNEAQISVSIHQHYCRATNLRGVPPFLVSEEILGKAKNIEAALAIIEATPVASSWAFIICDGKTRESVVVECNPEVTAVRRLESASPWLSHSNFYQTKACSRKEFATTARMNWDNYYRNQRLDSLLAEKKGDFEADVATQMISDHFDPFWGEEKILNRTVSQVYNIQSFVIDPERMLLWLAEGDCPIQLGEYVEYDLGAVFNGATGLTGKKMPSYRFQDPKKEKAKHKYILSFVHAFGGDLSTAHRYLLESLESDFTAEAAQITAVIEMKMENKESIAEERLHRAMLWIEEKAKHAAKNSAKNSDSPTLPPEYFEMGIYRARALDLMGKQGEAKKLYGRIAEDSRLEDEHLRALAKQAKPYRRRDLGKIVMPYSSYIPFE